MNLLIKAYNYLWHHVYYLRGARLREELSFLSAPYRTSLIRSPKIIGATLLGLAQSSAPRLVSRLGSVECQCVSFYLKHRHRRPYPEIIRKKLHLNAGVFGQGDEAIDFFAREYLKAIRHADLLGVGPGNNPWEHQILGHCFQGATIRAANGEVGYECLPDTVGMVPIFELEPFRHDPPWTEALAGRKVLVVHPFAESIQQNYQRSRKLLFDDPRMLPPFSLITIKSIQTIAGNSLGFAGWSEALDQMKTDISATDFDIALLGCGAYGLPLAAHIKTELKKTAFHVGGLLQLLFGITGQRWAENPWYVKHLINGNWSRPLETERPQGFSSVERGCYW